MYNMELCQIKLYGKIIDLEVGDYFWSNDNGASMYYTPIGHNILKIPRGNDAWNQNKYVSCQKYANEVRLADNLEKVRNIKGNDYQWKWAVKYVYKQDHPHFDDLIQMTISSTSFYVQEVKIERITEKYIFVHPHLPINCLSKIEKRILVTPQYHWDVLYGVCLPDDYEKLETILFDKFAQDIQQKVTFQWDVLKKLRQSSELFQELRQKYGHLPTKPKRTKYEKPS